MQGRINRSAVRRRIRHRIRKRIRGTASRPRVAVFRSSKHIYVQAIDDDAGRTLVAASTAEKSLRGDRPTGATIDAAKSVGGALAERLKGAGVEELVFDRGGTLYHGRVRALAEALREAGLKF